VETVKKNRFRLVAIVAVSKDFIIGDGNQMLWHLPNDLIMGRKTFDSFPGLLPNRKHIVISRNKNISFSDEVTVVNNFEDAIRETGDDENPFIIGGGQIYKLAMDLGDKIELTRVHEEFKADTFFPKIDEDKWKLIHEEFNEKDERHQFSFTYKTYIKIR